MVHKRSRGKPARAFANVDDQKAAILAAAARFGNLTSAATAGGIQHGDLRTWLRDDLIFNLQYEEAMETFHDLIEERLVKAIEAGDRVTLRLKARGELPQKYGRPSRPPKDSPARAKAKAFWDQHPIGDPGWPDPST